MSCGNPHETDCSEILDHLYEFLDREMPEGESARFQVHFDECSPCFEMYGLEQAVKRLVKRCCGHEDVPVGLRSKVMARIQLIQTGEAVPERSVMEQAVAEQQAARAGGNAAQAEASSTPPAEPRRLTEPGQA